MVALQFDGVESLDLTDSGALRVQGPAGTVLQHPPRCYLESAEGPKPVPGRFVLLGEDRAGFVVEDRALHQALVVDPTVDYIATVPLAFVAQVQLLETDALGAGTEQRYTLTTDYPAGDLPPQWGELALEYTVALGQTLSLQLPVIDESPLRYYAHPLPLPAGMVLESATGFWSYTPEAPGSYTLTLGATDERFRSERTVTIIVSAPDPAAPTRFQGRLLDANSMAQGTVWPITGATVSILHTQVSTRTDAEGNFTLSGIPEAESYILDLDPGSARPAPLGLGYAGFRERISLHAHVLNSEPRPFTLPRLAAEKRRIELE